MMTHSPTTAEIVIWIADVLLLVAWVGIIRTIIWRPTPAIASGEPLPLRGFPQQWHLAVLAVMSTALVIYGSLIPLDYVPLPFTDALKKFASIRYLTIYTDKRADWVANVLLAVPATFLSMGVFSLDQKKVTLKIWAAIHVVIVSVAVGVGLEFTQLWFPKRTISQNDIYAFSIGSFAGAALWLVLGQTSVNWIRHFRRASFEGRVAWLLEAFVVCVLIYSILPLDLVIHPEEIENKFYGGKINPIPFRNQWFDFSSVALLLRDFLIFVVVGMWAATWRTQAETRRSPWVSGIVGACLAATIEIAQLLVYSRHSSSQDVLSGLVASLVGAWAVYCIPFQRLRVSSAPKPDLRIASAIWLVAAIYAVALMYLLTHPHDRIRDPELIRQRFEHFFSTPFASLYRGSEFNATSEVARKLALFIPFSSLLILATHFVRTTRQSKPVLLAAAVSLTVALSLVIELLQVYYPPRVSDVTDVIIGGIGGGIGAYFTHRTMMALSNTRELDSP